MARLQRRKESMQTVRRVRSLVHEYGSMVGNLRLIARGISPAIGAARGHRRDRRGQRSYTDGEYIHTSPSCMQKHQVLRSIFEKGNIRIRRGCCFTSRGASFFPPSVHAHVFLCTHVRSLCVHMHFLCMHMRFMCGVLLSRIVRWRNGAMRANWRNTCVFAENLL